MFSALPIRMFRIFGDEKLSLSTREAYTIFTHQHDIKKLHRQLS